MRSLRSLCPLACLAACTFNSPDVDVDAAPADGSGGGMLVMVEELTVPSRGEAVTSQIPLQAGVAYRLRASGTFFIAFNTQADAEYYGFNIDMLKDGDVGIDVGLAVNDTVIDATRQPRWGTYDDTHVYEIDWMGEGAPITAQFHDGNYLNNTGELKLAILMLR